MRVYCSTHVPSYLTLSILAPPGLAEAASKFHKRPHDFVFGNEIDTHQETRLKLVKRTGAPKELAGFFYIIFTGAVDPLSGLAIARHPRGATHNEDCDVIACVVGWSIHARPGQAKFLFHSGVNGNDHPVWLVNRADRPGSAVSGIPQPGSYTHFHWITRGNTDPRADTVPPTCDQQDAAQLQSAGAANTVCPGWFLQIEAVEEFAFEHGGELIPVRPMTDNASHLNLLTNYAVVPGIDATR